LKALRDSTVKDLAASDTSENILGAVFSKVDSSKAQALLKEALK
jgi:hypothetical protein